MSEQRRTLDLKNLLAAPVHALHHAQAALSSRSLEFLELGLQADGDASRAITRRFVLERNTESVSEEARREELCIEVPLLTLISIPNLSIGDTCTSFSAELVCSRSARSGGPTELQCTPAAAPKQRRASDHSPKADMEVRLKISPPSEGLSRCLDRLVGLIGPIQRVDRERP